jgi:alanine racemase
LRAAMQEAGRSTSTASLSSLGMTEFSDVQVLVMCGVTREEVGAIVEHGLTPVVWTKEQVELLRGSGVRVHVEIETGMGRQGVRPGADLEELLRAIAAAELDLDGVCTHFSSAEVAGSERTHEQKKRFETAVEQAGEFYTAFPTSQNRDAGHPIGWIHAGASSSVDVGETAEWLQQLAKSSGARAMVRSGIALYGYALPVVGAGSKIRAKLKPVMTWKTRVLDVREVAAGETIGYNATFTAKHAMRVALLPVGYADGLRRELSGTNERTGGWVVVSGADGAMRRANIVGRVSMNLTVVDITGVDVTRIDGVRVGDEIVLLGDGITADDHARIAGTISYEILCGIRA